MLRSVLAVPSDIVDKIDIANKPTAHEIKLMHDLCTILKPFEEATNASQGQNIITSSQVIIIIRTLREELGALSRVYKSRLLSTLKHSIDTRLSKYEHMECFQLATVLDPHFKLDWCTDREVEDMKSPCY
uniref:Uncharacterized protein n=1 Tax=Amphimedon queenslandica TaxID=400682 RepID=A0A1X7V7H8_AMPQE